MDNSRKILIVDNSKEGLEITSILSESYNVVKALTKEEAETLLHENDISGLIINLALPDKDIKKIISTVRENDVNKIIVGISFENSIDEEIKALELRLDSLIRKPFNKDIIIKTINNLTDKYYNNKKVIQLLSDKAKNKEYESMHAVLENIDSGILIIKGKKTCERMYANNAYYNLFGYKKPNYDDSKENIMDKKTISIIWPLVSENIQNNTNFNVEFLASKRDGSEVWLQMRGSPINKNDDSSNIFLLSLNDITDIKKISNKLKNKSNELETLIENIPAGIFIHRFKVGQKITIDYFNDRVPEMLGYEKEEYKALFSHDYAASIYSEDVLRLEESVKEAISQKDNFTDNYRYIKKDGSFCHVQSTSTKISFLNDEYVAYTIVIDISKQKEVESQVASINKELKYRADHDLLTGIYNRTAFFKITRKLLDNNPNTRYCLIRFNIEKFKILNEMLGKAMGDKILLSLSDYYSKKIIPIGTYARLEADRFVVCVPKALFNPDKVVAEIDEILERLDIKYKVKFNLGIYDIHDRTVDVEKMSDRAGLAIEKIKGDYNNAYAFYDDSIRAQIIKEQKINSEMNKAIENEEFVLYFQPIYSYSKLIPVSAEVLVRWRNPKQGLISPGVFIPIFEKNGFITTLDYYVWEKACLFLHERRAQNLPIIPLSLNVSRISLYSLNVGKIFKEFMEKYNLCPSMIKLEITESVYTEDPYQIHEYIKELQEYGFEVAMDDFGSGYSSLNILKDMPVNILKLDVEFLGEAKTSSRAGNILALIVKMAKWLNMKIIAEGVETKAQATFLSTIGCDTHQGFYYSHPLDEDDFAKVIKKKIKKQTLLKNKPEFEEDFEQMFNENFLKEFIYENIIAFGIYEYDGQKLEAFRVNDKYYEILGYTPQTFIEKSHNVMLSIHKDDLSIVKKILNEVVKKKKDIKVVIRHYALKDKILYLDSTITYLGEKAGIPIIGIAFQDVTVDLTEEAFIAGRKIKVFKDKIKKV